MEVSYESQTYTKLCLDNSQIWSKKLALLTDIHCVTYGHLTF